MACKVHHDPNMQIIGRDGITMQVNGAQLTIVRDGSTRVETWTDPSDLQSRIAALSVPVVDSGEYVEIPYWRAA